MRFQYQDKTYFLEFSRKHEKVPFSCKGVTTNIVSKYPYTTVRLEELVDGARSIMAEHTVGCLPTDSYSNELGRIHALRGMTSLLPKELRQAVWHCYTNRGATSKR